MPFSLLGYFPKRRTPAPDWLAASKAEEVCSVSTCIAKAPPDWVDHWVHNDWGFCNTVADAISLIEPGDGEYVLYAYSIHSNRYSGGEPQGVDVALAFGHYTDRPVAPEPLPPDFVSIGFDVAGNSLSSYFECSPLSCNRIASEIDVNKYCLLDDLDSSLEAARRFSVEQPEPGDYYVVQVLRSQRLRRVA